MPDASLAFRLLLLTLALVLTLFAVLVLAGAAALVAWGAVLVVRARGSRVARLVWSLSFLVIPGPTHLVFALTRPTPPRFRRLAAGVSLSLAGFLLTLGGLVALMRIAGIPVVTRP